MTPLRPLLLFALLLVACQAAPQPEPGAPTPASATATAPAPAEPTAVPTPILTPAVVPPTVAPQDPILAACPAEAQQQPFRDDLAPDLAALGLDLCYDLQLTLDDDAAGFDAVARVTVRNGSEDPWPDLLFRLYPAAPLLFGGTIEVRYVSVDGIGVEAERVLPDETGLRVPLGAPLRPGGVVRVEVGFRGELATELSSEPKVYGIFARTEAAATLASWFPLLAVWDGAANRWNDVPVLGQGDAVFSESGLIQATLSAPEGFALASSGTVLEQASANGRTTYRVATGPARDFAMVWLDGYELGEVTVDGTRLRHWFLAGDEAGAEVAFDAAREALAIFNERFGPYPFEELDMAEVPLSGAGGVEYPQLFLLGQELYGNPNSFNFLGFASAHETAHQWWYSTIGNDINAAPWQDEALTQWSSLLWLEEAEGEGTAEGVAQSFQASVERWERDEGEEAVAQPLEAFQGRSSAYSTIVYLKGALFFDAVRQEIGDEAFFAALRDYYADNRFAIVPPAALLDRFEETSGQELGALYAEWGVE